MMKLTISLLLLIPSLAAEEVELTTSLGNVTGLRSTFAGQNVSIFRGIPYAKPPVGDLRLAKPQPYGAFQGGRLNATEFGEVCAQSAIFLEGSEDCLFLNIYTPQTPGSKSVMLWIHGGGFVFGKSNDFNGAFLAALEDVVVVTINYRLNIFGFLATGDAKLPGNYGLWDQRLAIQWVKENIEDYGGNGSAITIFGESAGGRSVGFQLMSPQNNLDLFQRAITQSGSALASTYINRDPIKVAAEVAATLGCNETSETFVTCIRSKSLTQLQTATKSVVRPLPFFPTIDNDFLKDDLGLAMSDFLSDNSFASATEGFGNFGSYDIFSGWNNQKGLIYMRNLLMVSQSLTGKNLSQGVSENVLHETLKSWPFVNYPQDGQLKELIVRIFADYYLSTPELLPSTNRSLADKRVEAYSRIAGDLILKIPTVQHLQLHSAIGRHGKAYAYEFTHRREGYDIGWYDGPDWLRYGADHSDDIPYVFGVPLNVEGFNYTTEEVQLSRDMMKMWASFAKTGNPGPEFSLFEYPRDQTYTVLDTDKFEQKTLPLNDVQRLWSAVDSTLLQVDMSDDSTPCNITEPSLKHSYLGGTVELTPAQANNLLTVLIIVCVLTTLISLCLIVYVAIFSYKYAKKKLPRFR